MARTLRQYFTAPTPPIVPYEPTESYFSADFFGCETPAIQPPSPTTVVIPTRTPWAVLFNRPARTASNL